MYLITFEDKFLCFLKILKRIWYVFLDVVCVWHLLDSKTFAMNSIHRSRVIICNQPFYLHSLLCCLTSRIYYQVWLQWSGTSYMYTKKKIQIKFNVDPQAQFTCISQWHFKIISVHRIGKQEFVARLRIKPSTSHF